MTGRRCVGNGACGRHPSGGRAAGKALPPGGLRRSNKLMQLRVLLQFAAVAVILLFLIVS
jgi:hypothetical protein